MTPPKDPNAHLKNYVDYYRGLEAPGFAVLITGDWGTGKTHLVRHLLPWDQEQSYYISLFGLKAPEDIISAIYAAMYPDTDKLQKLIGGVGEATKGVSVAGFGVGGVGSVLAGLVAAQMKREVDSSKVIIFDDLERSDISPKALLGIC